MKDEHTGNEIYEEGKLNEDGLVFSGEYKKTMEEIVLPWLKERRVDSTEKGFDGKPLFVSRFSADNPKGTVMILHGFTECVDKFSELIFSFLRHGWSVLMYDQRGHGRSWRDEKIKDKSLVHVERFEDYVEDMETLCESVLSKMPKPYVLFCHSMGGAVSGMFLEKHTEPFERAAMCAPMIAPNRNGMPLHLATGIGKTARAFGKSRSRVPITKPYSGPEDFETSPASGRERFDWYDEMKASVPEFQTNGPSYGWALESFGVTEKLLAPGAVERITIPVRVYGAERDDSVLQEEQKQFAERLPNGFRTEIPGSKHEIYRSGDAVFFPWWHEVLQFLTEER